MSPNELSEFRARCLKAKSNGHKVANAHVYAAMLESEGGAVTLRRGMAKHSAAHLVALADNVAKVRAEGGKKKAPAKAAKPAVPVAPAVEPEPVAVAKEEAVEEEKKPSRGRRKKKEFDDA